MGLKVWSFEDIVALLDYNGYMRMTKGKLIVSTVAAWLIACALYGNYYVVSILASPEPYDVYARNWDFQLLMFSLSRLPLLVLALAPIILLELVVVDQLKRRHVPS